MIYLADSSADGRNGHYLEYLQRVASQMAVPTALLVNRSISQPYPNTIIPTFTYRTAERGRYWLQRPDGPSTASPSRDGDRPSAPRLIKATDRATALARTFVRSGQILTEMLQRTRQAKQFATDLDEVLPRDTTIRLFVSSANERELAGLLAFISQRSQQRQRIQAAVMLRGVIVIPTSSLDAILEAVFAPFRLSVLRALSRNITFLADTEELVSYFESLLNTQVISVNPPALPTMSRGKRRHGMALSPGARRDTRIGLSLLTSQQRLSLIDAPMAHGSSEAYADWISSFEAMLLPYDPILYRYRSSGVFIEALTAGTLPVLPTGTSMSRFLAHVQSTFPREQRDVGSLKHSRRMTLNLPARDEDEDLRLQLLGTDPVRLQIDCESQYGTDSTYHDLTPRNALDTFAIPSGTSSTLRIRIVQGTFGNSTEVLIQRSLRRSAPDCGLSFRPLWISRAVQAAGEYRLSQEVIAQVNRMCEVAALSNHVFQAVS